MLLKRGILPVMAILTSLHSYGAINKTNNGTASATMKKGLTLAMTTPFGSIALAKTTPVDAYVSCNDAVAGNCYYYQTPSSNITSAPTAGIITITGEPNSAVQLAITKDKYSMVNGLYWRFPYMRDTTTGAYVSGINYLATGTQSGIVVLPAGGTSSFTIQQIFNIGTLIAGTATGNYTITVTYV